MRTFIDRTQVRTSTIRGAGLGLFAGPPRHGEWPHISAGQVVIESPAIFMPPGTVLPDELDGHAWYAEDDSRVFPLGNGAFVNHWKHPNVRVKIDRRRRTVSLIATTMIPYGSEVFADYGEDWNE